MEKKYPIGVEPNTSKHQDIILKVCKAHGIKSLELTTKYIALMSDCISEYISQQAPTGAVWVKAVPGKIKDGIYNMKCCCRLSNNIMLGVGLVTNGEIVLITYLNKSSYGKEDLPDNYEGIFYLDERAGEELTIKTT